MNQADTIAMHKLYAPPEYLGAVRRSAILERVLGSEAPHVVLLQAPAGHGKSTLLQQTMSLAREHGMLCAWLSFDEADNDVRRFVLHLEAMLRALDGKTPAALQASPAATRNTRSEWFTNRLYAAGAPVALFFDEFQTLSGRSALAFFRNLLEHVPERVRIFIGSRTVPDIGLARLVVNRQALILRGDDLRFSPEEVGRFFAGAQELAMQPAELHAIYDRTEGWPAALQLYRLSLARAEVRRSLQDLSSSRPAQLADYLADNVLALQSPRLREFLLRTSLLSRLCAPLCDAVMGREGSQLLLKELETSGLFLRSLDAELRWFRYHTLFSSFLSEQLREEAEDLIPEVHRRASAWYRSQRIYDEALHHALSCRDYSGAVDIFDVWATQLVMDGDLMTIERWYDRVPLEELQRRPTLVIKVAWALAFLRRRDKLSPVLKLLEQMPRQPRPGDPADPEVVRSMLMILQDEPQAAFEIAQHIDLDQPQSSGFVAFQLAAAGNLKGYLAMIAGNFEGAHEALALARSHGQRASAGLSQGYTVAVDGMNLMVQGRLPEALECFRRGVAEPRILLDESVSAASLVSSYIMALYEANELDTARNLFNRYHDMIANAGMHDFLAAAYVAMARIHEASGEGVRAIELLDEAELIGHAQLPRLVRIVAWERVRIWLQRGDAAQAAAIASRATRGEALPTGWLRFAEDLECEIIGGARLALHEHRSEEALRRLAPELDDAQRRRRVRRQIRLLILQALAHQQQGGEVQAHRTLQQALRLAALRGFLRAFLDEGPQLQKMLAAEAQREEEGVRGDAGVPAFLDRLRQASGAANGVAQQQATRGFEPLEALTDREKEFLVLLANGAANKVLARKMFVSENTVKFHLKNIYSKLGVSSRLQAISAARQMKLI